MRILSIFLLLFLVTACEVPGDYDSSDNGSDNYDNQDDYNDDDAGAYDEDGAYDDSSMSKDQADMIKTAGGDRVLFDFDSSKLDASDRKVVQGISKWMNKRSGSTVLVEGHCDERGTREYNLALGERRATAVKKYLTSLGISSSRVSTTTYGKERPAVQGSSADAWRQNRRAEVKANVK